MTYRYQRDSRRHMPYCGNDPQLMEPAGEPLAEHWEQARHELGAWASNSQIERRALQLLDDELRDNDRMAEESLAEDGEDWTLS